jgi:hypothetical protein
MRLIKKKMKIIVCHKKTAYLCKINVLFLWCNLYYGWFVNPNQRIKKTNKS